MHARRLVGLAVLTLPALAARPARADDPPPAAPLAPAAPAAPAEATWPVTFATEPVSNDPMPGDRVRAVQDFEPIDLAETAPAGVAAPADKGRVLWAQVGPETKRCALAIVRGDGDSLAVFVDANADGTLDPATERVAATATPATAGTRRVGTSWKVPSIRTTGAPLLLQFTETLPRWSGVLAPPVSPPQGDRAIGPLRIEFADAAPAGAKAPATIPTPMRWATGEYQGKSVVLAVGREEGGTLHAALFDATGAKPEDKPATAAPVELRQGKVHMGSRWTIEGLEGGGVRGSLTVVETLPTLTGRLVAASSRRGSATIGGAGWVVLLVDGDADGRFDSKRDLWYVGPSAQFRNATYANMFEATEPFRATRAGGWDAYRLVSVDEKGAAVVAREPAPGPLAEYLERRAERVNEGHWFPIFRAQKEAFQADQGIDPKRPAATPPPRFRYVADFDAAKAIAAKEGKPLLVDFEADWCVWCKRLDFFSYVDAEVAQRLAKFTCLKMNVDFDPTKTLGEIGKVYGREEWGGLPAVGVFHADGVPVEFSYEMKKPHRAAPDTGVGPAPSMGEPAGPEPAAVPEVVDHVSGFLPPQKLVTALDAAYTAWKAGAKRKPVSERGPAPTAAPSK